MISLISWLAALIALGTSILIGIDPIASLIRGVFAYFMGRVSVGIWMAILEVGKDIQQESASNNLQDDDDLEPEAAA